MQRMAWLLAALVLALPGAARAERIGDLVDVLNREPLVLEGTGIVVGLSGTGDKARAAVEGLTQYLNQQDYRFSEKALVTGNIALVRVTAVMPPNKAPGQRIAFNVTALNDAKSLNGGELVQTQLFAGDGRCYAVAAGPLSVGSHLTAGRGLASQRGGAQIILGRAVRVVENGRIYLLLKESRSSTAKNIAAAINRTPFAAPPADRGDPWAYYEQAAENPPIAFVRHSGQVVIQVPTHYRGREEEFLDDVLQLQVDVDLPPRILIDRSSGSAVVVGSFQIKNALITHNDKTITLRQNDQGEMEYPLDPDTPRRLASTQGPYAADQDLQTLADTLNAWGFTSKDMIEVFTKLQRAGAFHAEIIEE